MQIVINIGEHNKNVIDRFVNGEGFEVLPTPIVDDVIRAVRNGKPLPKGHGKLIDADAFIKRLEDTSKRQRYKELLIDDCLSVDDVFKAVIESLQNEGLTRGHAPTIIEADKED